MAQQLVDTTTNNGSYIGDPASTAFTKLNENDTELYSLVSTAQTTATNANNGSINLRVGVSNSSSGTIFQSGAAPNISAIDSSGNSRKVPLQISNGSNNSASAVMAFIREGVWGCFLGVDASNNKYTVGGWSFGAVQYDMFHGGVDILPSDDNLRAVGASNRRFTQFFATSATINTSDQRYKTDIVDTTLGLDFVLSLRPVRYKLIEACKTATSAQTGVSEVKDDEGNVVSSVPVYTETLTPRAGVREHEGFIAQEVNSALTAAGVDPKTSGIWTLDDPNDSNSRQGLRYEEMVSVLAKAVQEQHALIVALTARVAALESPAAASGS